MARNSGPDIRSVAILLAIAFAAICLITATADFSYVFQPDSRERSLGGPDLDDLWLVNMFTIMFAH